MAGNSQKTHFKFVVFPFPQAALVDIIPRGKSKIRDATGPASLRLFCERVRSRLTGEATKLRQKRFLPIV